VQVGRHDNRLVDAIENLTRRLAAIPEIQAIYLFGSQAAGTATDASDVDLALRIGTRISLGDELRLRAIAVEGLHRDDIDFVILDLAPPLLRYEVITRGKEDSSTKSCAERSVDPLRPRRLDRQLKRTD
jgi:predicted nucleotidyltransferase